MTQNSLPSDRAGRWSRRGVPDRRLASRPTSARC